MKITINCFLFILICAFTSCSKSEGNGLPDEGGFSSNSYWPHAIGNIWYLVNPDDQDDISEYIIHKTLTHENKTYFQFKPVGIDTDIELTNGVREDNGLFYELHGSIDYAGVKITPGTLMSINTKLPVGEVWKDEVTLNVSGATIGTIKHINEGKILQKSASETINGKTYKDVLKTEVKKTVINSLTGIQETLIFETWLAKGVGIIFEKNTYSDYEVESYGLISYTLN